MVIMSFRSVMVVTDLSTLTELIVLVRPVGLSEEVLRRLKVGLFYHKK